MGAKEGTTVGRPEVGELDGGTPGDKLGAVVGGTEHSDIKP